MEILPKGAAYIFAAVPYSSVPRGDYGNAYVKAEIRKILFAFPFFAEKGLFLLYYGPVGDWKPFETNQADSTSSDRWCGTPGAGYDRRRRAA